MREPLSHTFTVRSTHPEPAEHKMAIWLLLLRLPSCGCGCCFLPSGLLDSKYLNTVLWHVRMCQLSHKSCSPMSMHFAKISKMKTPRAWAPWLLTSINSFELQYNPGMNYYSHFLETPRSWYLIRKPRSVKCGKPKWSLGLQLTSLCIPSFPFLIPAHHRPSYK